jgi:hypothetical protein
MMELRKSLYRMKFTDRFKGDGKKLYDRLVELSDNENIKYYKLLQHINNVYMEVVKYWLSQYSINNMLKKEKFEYDLTVVLYDENKEILEEIEIKHS